MNCRWHTFLENGTQYFWYTIVFYLIIRCMLGHLHTCSHDYSMNTQPNRQPSTCFVKGHFRKSLSNDHNISAIAFPYLLLTSQHNFDNLELKILKLRRIKHTKPKTEKTQY